MYINASREAAASVPHIFPLFVFQSNLLVVESKTRSWWTGKYIYSDCAYSGNDWIHDTPLNKASRIPLINTIAGIVRMALAVIHCLYHATLHIVTKKMGHRYHALKGVCEMSRATTEGLPFIGWFFASDLDSLGGSGMKITGIKMYNPDNPDGVDRYMNNWTYLKDEFPKWCIKA